VTAPVDGVGPKELALAFFDALNRHDPESACGLLAGDGFVDIVPARIKGTTAREGRRFVRGLMAAFPDLWIQVRSTMATPEMAVVEVKMEGTQARDFLGILNQEKHLDLDQAWMVWGADGRITGLRAYFCQNQLYRRLAVKRLDRICILG
jgi:ketosteroid isomerase-like protein